MPVYNTPEDILRETIESILNQIYTVFELIVVNDSHDPSETREIIKTYPDQRIRYYGNETNIGMSKTYNKMVKLVNGKYLMNSNHDDISVRLYSRCVGLFQNHRERQVVNEFKPCS